MSPMFFAGFAEVGRIIIVGVLAYLALVLMLRVSGKRTLSKMNAFDLVVTVALGSTLATIILSKDISLAGGILALALLISLQFVITWLSVRFPQVSHLVKAEPALLLYRGQFLDRALRRERVTRSEVLAGVREQGLDSLTEVEAVVLETDGSFSIVRRSGATDQSALAQVRGGAGRLDHIQEDGDG